MNKIIEEYYIAAKVSPVLLNRKIEKFANHSDISAEFEYWINTKKYLENNCVCVQGYTAKMLSELSPLLKGEGSFDLLIDLRENPTKALKQIKNGFKVK